MINTPIDSKLTSRMPITKSPFFNKNEEGSTGIPPGASFFQFENDNFFQFENDNLFELEGN